ATENVATEVIQNAISASTQDPRFPSVSLTELNEIKYSVDVLSPPERVYDKTDLDPKRFGIVVKKGLRSGLLLPDLEGVDTVEEQLSIVRLKAGISPVEDIEIYRFKV
ncbi:MAG TPA: AMMECR1 domain-containing protein, partial [Nitrospiraceae bacterium]|nr:AMMECR1 domain-containing protein [Nitrospiraceae bacterium]